MRRFASVFTKKRDKPESTSQPSPLTTSQHQPTPTPAPLQQQRQPLSTSLSLKRSVKRAQNVLSLQDPSNPLPSSTSIPPVPQLTSEGPPTFSSSGSSASGSLQTPDDDYSHHSHSGTRKKSWKAWLAVKKPPLEHADTEIEAEQNQPSHNWRNRKVPSLCSPSADNRISPETLGGENTEDDTTSEETKPSPQTSRPLSIPSAAVNHARLTSPPHKADAIQTLSVLIRNGLVSPIPVFPFLHQSGQPIYPRSCNSARHLAPPLSIRSTMHKKRLLHRLEFGQLSQEERQLIAPFASHPPPAGLAPVTPSCDDIARPKPALIKSPSQGIRQWISRPCFEDRYDVYQVIDGIVNCRKVAGPPLGVAALEYSEFLDLIAAPEAPEAPILQPPSMAPAAKLLVSQQAPASTVGKPPVSASLQARTSSHASIPSPLRKQHNSPDIPPAAAESTPAPSPATKRGVRFAEDDKDDVIPLGYVLRMKQRHKAKAKFLRDQQEQRESVEKRKQTIAKERQQQEERERAAMRERLEREALQERQRTQMEQEKQRRAAEEENRQRLLAEEVSATRLRREAQRAGGVPALRNSTNAPNPTPLLPKSSSTSILDYERNKPREVPRYTRPAYDPLRREGSEPTNLSIPPSPHSSSPGSSRRSSTADHIPTTPGSTRGSIIVDRPTSMYSVHTQSSSESVGARDKNKRGSVASVASYHSDYLAGYSMWAASNPSLIPLMPPVPAFAMDMPLLPPTAPFMLQQYPRQRSPGPSNASSSRSRRADSTSESHRRHTPSSHRPDYPSSSTSSLASSRSPESQTHQHRRYSVEAKSSKSTHSSSQQMIQASSRSQPSTTSRGRPIQSIHTQAPSPWSALPSESGQLPQTMPTYGLVTTAARSTLDRRQSAM